MCPFWQQSYCAHICSVCYPAQRSSRPSFGRICHSQRFTQSNRFDLELIRVLSITYQLSLAHFVLRSSANVNSYLMYVKPGQGQNLVEVARGRHPWRTGQPEDILKNATGLGIAAFVPRS